MPEKMKSLLIQTLSDLGYEYLNLENESDLIINLRQQIETLNSKDRLVFSSSEWDYFFNECICKEDEDYKDKLQKIQGSDFCQRLIRDNESTVNVLLVDREDLSKNKLQFIDKYSHIEEENSFEQFVTILMNGFPMVHIMLYPSHVELERAFEQLDEKWKYESFCAKWNFFDFIEIFVISNGIQTKYFSCSTFKRMIQEKRKSIEDWKVDTNNSFLFTSYWSNIENVAILDLLTFSKIFLEQKNIKDIIMKFSVLAKKDNKEEINLKIMRPYQIYATQRILNRIEQSISNNLMGTKMAGGYIWHSTGSGKTLTSFKVCKLALKIPKIEKSIFVADRKDIDYQTQKEYITFESDASQGTKSTKELERLLMNPEKQIITTTIQKLSRYAESVKKNKNIIDQKKIFEKNIVIVFDECHRTQFGKMHDTIRRSFTNSHIFGFTGTPILSRTEEDESPSQEGEKDEKSEFLEKEARAQEQSKKYKSREEEFYISTAQRFGDRLHRYTLFNAISDENVLKFKVEFVGDVPVNEESNKLSEEEAQFESRVKRNVSIILKKFDDKTLRRPEASNIKSKRKNAYNSILTVSSIKLAQKYYSEFKNQLISEPEEKKLIITTIYTSQEEKKVDASESENNENPAEVDAEEMTEENREFLKKVIDDYNEIFKTTFSLNRFYDFYKDVSKNTKEGEIDILIVVDMFCTGFDAPGLNTLWVDKKLQKHGLIQAFSRTNRIFRKNKEFGNIVCFRTGKEDMDFALNKYAGSGKHIDLIIAPSFEELYSTGTINWKTGEKEEGYQKLIEFLKGSLDENGEFTVPKENIENFLKNSSSFFRKRNLLRTYDEFTDDKRIVDDEFVQKLQSKCISLYEDEIKNKNMKLKKNIINSFYGDVLQAIKEIEINLGYIINIIVENNWEKIDSEESKNSWQEEINRMMDSSINLRNKKDIINGFIDYKWSHFSKKEDCDSFSTFISKKIKSGLEEIINSEGLRENNTKSFLARSFRDRAIGRNNIDFEYCFNDISRINSHFSQNKMNRVFEKFQNFFDKYNEFETFVESTKKWINSYS